MYMYIVRMQLLCTTCTVYMYNHAYVIVHVVQYVFIIQCNAKHFWHAGAIPLVVQSYACIYSGLCNTITNVYTHSDMLLLDIVVI